MHLDDHGILRIAAFVVVLVALFAAPLFRPNRIRQRNRLWVAAILLAVALLLECVGPLFTSVPIGTLPNSGGRARIDLLATEIEDYLNALKVVAVLQHLALAAALLAGLSAFFDKATISGHDVPLAPERRPHQRASAERRRTSEGACLSCGRRMPPNAAKCPACGWTWGSEQEASV